MSCAPNARIPAFFSGLLPDGTQIVTGAPNVLPASASPSPWLPRVAATIPRLRCSSESAVTNENPFRTLNEFVGLKFSCFTDTPMPWPTSASSVGYERMGETGTYARMRSRALVIASRSTGHTDRGSTSGIIRGIEVNVSGAVLIVRHEHVPRAAAHLTVLDV